MKKSIRILILLILANNLYSFSGEGKGTAEDPYQITNVYELQECRDDPYAFYILINDIDASETRTWNLGNHDRDSLTPDEYMGFSPIRFWGDFNGNGKIVYNLYINLPGYSYVGLFAELIGYDIRVYRLGIVDCDITGDEIVGALFGAANDLGGSIISECFTAGSVKSIKGGSHIGGFGGFIQWWVNRIENCYSRCSVEVVRNGGYIASFSNWGTPINCYTTGKLSTNELQFSISPFGVLHKSQINYCYYDYETTSLEKINEEYKGAKGYSTSEMYMEETYKGFDFDSVWCIDEGKNYPKLRVFDDCPGTEVEVDHRTGFNFELLPNPATNLLEIKIPIVHPEYIHIIIYNFIGIKIHEEKGIYSSDVNNSYTVDLTMFQSGSYNVVVATKSNILSKKFLIYK